MMRRQLKTDGLCALAGAHLISMFFERHQGGERAVLVQLQLAGMDRDLSILEFEELVASAGGEPVVAITGSRSAPACPNICGRG